MSVSNFFMNVGRSRKKKHQAAFDHEYMLKTVMAEMREMGINLRIGPDQAVSTPFGW
jgi:hypothetical protein